MRTTTGKLLPMLAAGLAVALSSCGGGTGAAPSGAGPTSIPAAFQAPTAPSGDAKPGGHLTVLTEGDVDSLDPGIAYYQYTYEITLATQRTLMGWPPDATQPVPDLAADQPKVTDGGKEITFTIRRGVHYGPPVDREVRAQDVKYAIERALLPGVANSYIATYFDHVEGFNRAEAQVKKDPTAAPDISGITTPDDHTLVIKLTRSDQASVIQALSLPVGAPVPEAYARKFDSRSTSTYGQYVVATGPYMVQNDCVDSSGQVVNKDCTGKLTGYSPGSQIALVRNPNWTGAKEGDFRPAYLDSITFQEGFSDPNSASQKILSDKSEVNGDFNPSKSAIQEVATGSKYDRDQMAAVPAGANRYVSLNMSEPPFGPGGGLSARQALDIRRAVLAGTDRTALRNTRGGELIGPVATHFIPPGIPGFQEAGGYGTPKDPSTGKPLDFVSDPNGNMKLAESYMRKAGFGSGKCEGSICNITMVGDNTPPGSDTATAMKDQLSNLGFNVNLQEVDHTAMQTRFCSEPSNEPNVCPNMGWIKDFNDGQSMLQVAFSGQSINQSFNANFSQLNDPRINRAINQAVPLTGASRRARAWGRIDDQIMAQAPAIPWVWDNDILLRSSNVNAVANLFSGEWDMAYTSLSR